MSFLPNAELFLIKADGLLHLDDERVEEWVDVSFPLDERRDAWNRVCANWLDRLAEELPGNYRGIESDHFFLVADLDKGRRDDLIRLAEHAWSSLQQVLGTAVRLSSPGKQVVIAFNSRKTMFQFAGPYLPEGKLASFAGLYIHQICPLVLLQDNGGVSSALVHELLHAAVAHLSLPQWLDEGLAQSFEVDHGVTPEFVLTPEEANNCRSYWRKKGLDRFWSGEGFHRQGRCSAESYRLARILARLLLDDAKPGWWGLGRARQQKLIRFLETARVDDAGDAAARDALGYGIVSLAERFLGQMSATTSDEPEDPEPNEA